MHAPAHRLPGLQLAPSLLLSALIAGAAQAGFPEAMVAYDNGDHATAAREARGPAEAGDADAQLLLGDLYAEGRGVPQDFVYAHLWYNLAAARGLAPGVAARDALSARMTPAQLAEAQSLARSWQPTTAVAAPAPPVTPSAPAVDAAEVQRELARLGYDPGPADGKPGRRTRSAVEAFQADAGIPVDGELTESLLVALREASPPAAAPAAAKLPPVMATSRATPLHTLPDSGAARVAELPPGARVMTGESRGTWVRVRALAPASGTGWVDSYALAAVAEDTGVAQPGDTGSTATQPAAGGVGDLFQGLARGVSGLFGGGSTSTAGSTSGAATIGIRGFDTAEFAAGRPNAAEFARLDGYAASAEEAGRFAAELGLTPARVAYLPDPAPAAGVTPRGRDK